MEDGSMECKPSPGFHLSGEVEARGAADTKDKFKVSVSFDRSVLASILDPLPSHKLTHGK